MINAQDFDLDPEDTNVRVFTTDMDQMLFRIKRQTHKGIKTFVLDREEMENLIEIAESLMLDHDIMRV